MFNNTIPCCDLKTILRSDRILKAEKEYTGILRRDVEIEDFRYDEHYTFIETLPCVFAGRYITITRRDDGTLRLNFRPLRTDSDFSIDGYAIGVCNELRQALEGLVEER